jgi:putative transposase
MRRNKLCLYVHLVWATWDRMPLLNRTIERDVYRNVENEAVKMGCTVIAINGMPDHVHLLVKLPTTMTVADLVKQVKGVSSHFANETLLLGSGFKWQGSYGAFTVSRWDLDKITGYVKRQKEHHEAENLLPEWEETYEEVIADEPPPAPE